MQNEERINGLETQVRTLKRIVYGFGCLLVAGVVVSATTLQTVPDVIQAKSFEVISENGKPVVVLNSHLLDTGESDVNERVYYGSMSSLNSKGGTLVTLGSNNCTGTGQIATLNGYGRLLVKLGYKVDGTPGLAPVAYDSGLVTTYAINGAVTSNNPLKPKE
ncbi:MAG: hypothetical protein QF718_03845 [Phycisphaerales bacterium]|jgi:hypothetical protein|nr:hypothetical protein [Phycisphaerales bacterium]